MITDVENILSYIIILNLLLESDMTGCEIAEKFDEIADEENTGFDMNASCFLEELCDEKSVSEIYILNTGEGTAKTGYCITERGKKRYKQLLDCYSYVKDTTDKVWDRIKNRI